MEVGMCAYEAFVSYAQRRRFVVLKLVFLRTAMIPIPIWHGSYGIRGCSYFVCMCLGIANMR